MINKKYMLFGLPLLALVLISAVAYYSFFTVTFNVVQPIQITGELDQSIPVNAPEVVLGKVVTITNNGDVDRIVTLTTEIIEGDPENVEISYIGKIEFAQKDLQTWIPINDVREEIEYTITGDNFVVNGIPEGYTLIYYPNTEGDIFSANIANVKVLAEGSNDIESLPIELDVGDDYCNIGEPDFNEGALVCRGAKLWLIPGDSITALAKLSSWSEASTYLFETDLITYTESLTGEVLVPALSTITFYPQYDFDEWTNGTYKITTTIA